MAGKRETKRKSSAKSSKTQSLVPDVYREMLAEALPSQTGTPLRPVKRQKKGHQNPLNSSSSCVGEKKNLPSNDIVLSSEKVESGSAKSHSLPNTPPRPQQIAYKDSDEDSEESDYDWENVELDVNMDPEYPVKDLELTLSNSLKAQPRRNVPGKRALSKADRLMRLGIHKIHVLCLLSYLHRRNNWCNDEQVQSLLQPLLTKNLIKFLLPNSSLSQFGRTESLKRGLHEISTFWNTRFSITERGMRRALWSDDTTKLEDFSLPDGTDSVNDFKSFCTAATELQGSRDVGAQLFCALLRSADVDTRLVFSIQALPFKAGGPLRTIRPPVKTKSASDVQKQKSSSREESNYQSAGSDKLPSGPYPLVARRLGHPNAADYNIPQIGQFQMPASKIKQKEIRESPYPIFWVEVFDEAHQRWLSVDPLVTQTIAKPRKLEPPASDQENNMTYVIAIDKDGFARDVTRRYVKAYNGKTRKGRVESTPGGEKWWKKIMRGFSRGWYTDADQIELMELANAESMEPMPKNIVDFKDHSYYALERHLRRNEVLISARECGKVAVGRDSRTTGGKKMESIYRRQDVKTVRSANAWYRMGRDIKIGEQPAKVVQSKKPNSDDSCSVVDRSTTNLYTEEQTQIYVAPPVVNGRVPKNSYGNIDIFVPTMVPNGGVHLPCRYGSRAARILNVDYADALTGFEFRGRLGTAILTGVVVASEYSEAVQAVVDGLEAEEEEMEERVRGFAARKMWKHFLIALRIKERIDGYGIDDDHSGMHEQSKLSTSTPDDAHFSADDDDDDDDDDAGGFIPD